MCLGIWIVPVSTFPTYLNRLPATVAEPTQAGRVWRGIQHQLTLVDPRIKLEKGYDTDTVAS
jgi:hypothetical protein